MPTICPRITITLAVEDYAILSRLSELQGRPMSRIVAELVGELTPALEHVVDTMEQAVQARESVTQSIRRAVADAGELISPHALGVLGQIKEFEGDLRNLGRQLEGAVEEGGDRGKRSAPVVSLPGGDPRPVITGVRKSQKKAKSAAKSTAYKRRA